MDRLVIFYGTPNNKNEDYKYAKYDGQGWTIFWYLKNEDKLTIFPLDNEDIKQLINAIKP
ncbi:MAG: hypothetical protein WDA59_07250 [Methanofastidiosum sp.]|jgi:hypothetical protein